MIDKLSQLQRKNKHFTPFSPSPLSAETLNHEEQAPYLVEGIQEDFFRIVTQARGLIQGIKKNNESIQTIRVQYEKAITAQKQKSYSLEMEAIVNENSSYHIAIKKLLEEIKKEVDDCQRNPELANQPQTKMKKNLFLSVSSELAKTVEQERISEDGYKNSVKNKITRQVRLVDKNLTENQVEHYINHPDEAQQMLQKRIYGQASNSLKNAVTDIQDKFRDIQRLQQSVSECLQLFKELSQMVFAQGQAIDNIEVNVNQAKDYVEKSDKLLIKAKKRHQCTKKCMCWLILVGGIILVVVLCIVIPVALKAVK